MKRICILIPTFPPHFKYAREVVKSFKRHNLDKQADLYFVFSDNNEKEAFGDYKNCIILPISLRVFVNGGIINIKKLYGLFQLMNDYEYIIVMDDEVKFIKNTNLVDVCETFYDRKVLYGNQIYDTYKNELAKIVIQCQTYFLSNKDNKKLSSNLYLWFNQLCIYKTAYLKEFFEVTNILKNLKNLAYNDFDYYIYMFYLILYHDFTIEDIGIKTLCGCLEENLMYEVTDTAYKDKYIYACTKYMYKLLKNPRLFIIMHKDRSLPKWVVKIKQLGKRAISTVKRAANLLPGYRVSLRIEAMLREIDIKLCTLWALDKNLYYMRTDYERVYWGSNNLLTSAEKEENTEAVRTFFEKLNKACKENEIKYWLYGKSLLSLQRGSGYFALNKKLSVGMLREDFEVLRQFCTKKTEFQISYKLDQEEVSREIILHCHGVEATIFVFDEVLLSGDERTTGTIFMSLYHQKQEAWNVLTCDGKEDIDFNGFLEDYRKKAINKINNFSEGSDIGDETLALGLEHSNDGAYRIHTYNEIFPLKKITSDGQVYYIPNNSSQTVARIYGDYSLIPSALDETK